MKATITKTLICRAFRRVPIWHRGRSRYVTTETNGTNMVVFLKRLSIPGSAKASLAVMAVEKTSPSSA